MLVSLIAATVLSPSLESDHGHATKPSAAKPAVTTTGKKNLGGGSWVKVYPPEPEMTPNRALALLTEGNARFAKRKVKNPHREADRLAEVAKGQHPFAAILGCADSRLSPELIFDQGFGDLFVVRVAGNVVDTFGIASLEYSIEHLGAQVVVVLGHERCGAVKAACDTFVSINQPVASVAKEEHEHTEHFQTSIPALVEFIMPSVAKAASRKPHSLIDAAIEANVKDNQAALLEKSPMVKSLVAKGKLKIVGGVYDLDTGMVKLLK
jgi:carbonic anhydrase